MKSKKTMKLTALVLSLVFLMVGFAGCGKSSNAEKSVIRYNIGGEEKTIDPALNNSVNGGTLIHAAFEGLMKLNEKDAPIPGMAEKWEVSPDGLKYTFHLRDAKWSDGQPVKAQDFEYAWKRALAPETAAEYAYQLFYLKNGEAYNAKKASVDDVGVKAIDDKTLEATLEYPVPYFLSLMAFPTYMPVRKDIVEANKEQWALKPETYIGNGPFVLKEWKPKDIMVFEKSPTYYAKDQVTLDRLEVKMIEEPTSYLAAFKSGQLDYIESPPAQETPQLLKDGTAQALPYLGTYFFVYNVSDKAEKVDPAAAKALKDVRVRKALAYAIDRQALIDNAVKGGQTPADSFVPIGTVDQNGVDFKNKSYYNPNGDPEAAKKLLAEAGYPNGQGFPKLTFMYNSGAGHQNVAQALQDMWKKNLNINVELVNQEWKVFQKTRTNKDYLIARHGWIADYVDPMTFLDMWVTGYGNNDAGYSNPQYDKLIADARKEVDPAKRADMLHQAEDILMNDMPIVPLYYYKNIVCIKPYVKNTRKSVLGFVFFDKATVDKH